ncbi:MAG: hypothetical protein KAS72_04755 [Phycisphaerales bacterium]|nr:hypothetical protein [Phycisphaerales bacterium]
MKLSPRILVLLLLAASVLAITIASQHMRSERAKARRAETRLLATACDAQRVLDLRARHQRVAGAQRPEQDVSTSVRATLASIGLPSRCLTSLAQDADAPLPDALGAQAFRRQDISVTLDAITTMQLGAFLEAWLADQPLWTPTSIMITHAGRRSSGDGYSVRITITAIYISDTTGSLP